MSKKCSCGFIIDNGSGWLLCHPTNAGNRWDFPKGVVDENETHLDAAIRELHEETGFIFDVDSDSHDLVIVDIGQHFYTDQKDLHLFYVLLNHIDTKSMHCHSMVKNKKGPDYPEMDAFAVFDHHKVASKLAPRMLEWIDDHVPRHLLIGVV